jgi:hypothetical protein
MVRFSENVLDLHLSFTDARSLVPVQLGDALESIGETIPSYALSLAPAAWTIPLSQTRDLPDPRSDRKRFNMRDLANDDG